MARPLGRQACSNLLGLDPEALTCHLRELFAQMIDPGSTRLSRPSTRQERTQSLSIAFCAETALGSTSSR